MKITRHRVILVEDRGVVMTEFAIVIPVILLIIFGMIQLLFIVNAKTILQQAAFDAVRSAVVYSGDRDKAENIAKNQTKVLIKGLGNVSGEPEINVTEVGDAFGGEEMSVEVKVKLSLLPFFKQAIMAGGGSGDFELVATAVSKKEPYYGK